MANVSEIREQLAQLLSNQISLDEFEDWFVPYNWNIHKQGSEAAKVLAYSIDHQLCQFDEDGPALRRALLEALFSFLEIGSLNQSSNNPELALAPESSSEVAFTEAVLV